MAILFIKLLTNRLTLDNLNFTDAVLSGAEGAVEGLKHLFGETYARYEI